MKLISHRGNIDSIKPERENTQAYIDEAIGAGYDVEIDVWRVGGLLFLGHDGPEHLINKEWLLGRGKFLWVHCKNFAALSYLIDHDVRTFYHRVEQHTIINNCNLIWSHDLEDANEKSIIPLLSEDDIQFYDKFSHVHGICSDFIAKAKK